VLEPASPVISSIRVSHGGFVLLKSSSLNIPADCEKDSLCRRLQLLTSTPFALLKTGSHFMARKVAFFFFAELRWPSGCFLNFLVRHVKTLPRRDLRAVLMGERRGIKETAGEVIRQPLISRAENGDSGEKDGRREGRWRNKNKRHVRYVKSKREPESLLCARICNSLHSLSLKKNSR